jgi:hypothetical protein
MSYNITDINGEQILDNLCPFIKISIPNNTIYNLLKFLDKTDEGSIFDINMDLINKILNEYKINNNYKQFYQIYIKKDSPFPSFILLINSKYTKKGQRRNGIMKFNNGNLWTLHNDKNYIPFSIFYINHLNDINYYLVDKNFLTSNPQLYNGLYSSQEISSLSLGKSYSISIVTQQQNKQFRLMDNNGNYITHTPSGKIELKTGEYSNLQNMDYSEDGLLMLDNNCLTIDTDNSITLKPCDNSSKQKWYKSNNTFISADTNSCLTSNSDTVILDQCIPSGSENDDKSQDWTTVNGDNNTSKQNNYRWQSYKGKAVVLVRSDNPWYQNKDITEESIFIEDEVPEGYGDKYIYKNGNFKSNFILDPTKSNMGYGYSYKSRLGKPCHVDSEGKIIEGFGDSESKFNKMLDLLIIVLSLMILFMFITRKLKI